MLMAMPYVTYGIIFMTSKTLFSQTLKALQNEKVLENYSYFYENFMVLNLEKSHFICRG